MMIVIVTVCDIAANEYFPVWPQKQGAILQKLRWSSGIRLQRRDALRKKCASFEAIFADIRQTLDGFLTEAD